jgi:regulator of sigma E protease
MVIHFLLSIFFLFFLVCFHEFFHFIFAKRAKIEVEEFGFGYPPRILKRKIFGTNFSFNLLPFGGFLKISEEELKRAQPLKKAKVIFGGILSFWILSFFLFFFLNLIGFPTPFDEKQKNFVPLGVQVLSVVENSPAKNSGIEIGDLIKGVKTENNFYLIFEVDDFKKLIESERGKTVEIFIQRGKNQISKKVQIPTNPLFSKSYLGVGIEKMVLKKNSFFESFFSTFKDLFSFTFFLIQKYLSFFYFIFTQKEISKETVGPFGFLYFSQKIINLGINYILLFLAQVSISLAVFNSFPIPPLDGGKLLFVFFEYLDKELARKVEEKISLVVGVFLLVLIFIVSFRDLKRFIW